MEEIKESHESEKELRERAELWLESLKLNRLCEGKPFARDAHNDIRALIAHLDAKCERAFEAARDAHITNYEGVEVGMFMSVCGRIVKCEWVYGNYADWNKEQS